MPNLDMSKIIDLNGVGAIRDWVRENFLLISDAEQMMSSKVRITFGSDFVGENYTIAGGASESYTGVVPATLVVEQSIRTLNAIYTVTCDTTGGVSYTRTVDVGMYYGIYPMEFLSFLAYLTCSSDPLATITATSGNNTYTGQTDRNGACTLNIGVAGTYAVTATLNGETTSPVSVEITTSGDSYTCTLPSLLFNPVPFATGTDEEIAAMLDAAKAGSIDLQTDGGWSVGDVRTIPISAFISGGGAGHAAQSIDIVITSFADYNSCGAVMQFDFKDALAKNSRMNASSTNVGGYGSSEMYSKTLPALVNALPAWLKSRLLEFDVLSSAGGESSTINTVTGNKLALRSEVELLGVAFRSKDGEGTRIPYYAIFENYIKKYGHSGSTGDWWVRSPYNGGDAYFCYVNSRGDIDYNIANASRGVAPFGCI